MDVRAVTVLPADCGAEVLKRGACEEDLTVRNM
jgi:hypothetical protein